MIRRDKIVRKRSLKELRREREEKRDDALRHHEELRKAELQSKKAAGQVCTPLPPASAVCYMRKTSLRS